MPAKHVRFVPLLTAIALLAWRASAAETLALPAKAQPAAPAVVEPSELFKKILELNRIQEPELDVPRAQQASADLIAKARDPIEKAATPAEKIAALNKALLADRQVSYLSNIYWRDASLAASLLRNKGNCLSTSTLYLLAGEALHLPIHMVLIPHHAFVRWDDGQTRINIETTNDGACISDNDYLNVQTRTDPEDAVRLRWGQSLEPNEALAELVSVAAQHRLGQNDIPAALELLDRAIKLAPSRTDIWLNRCAVLLDIPEHHQEALRELLTLVRVAYRPAPTVATGALELLAHDAAARGDHAQERTFLLQAFVKAPRPMQVSVLSSLAFCLRALRDYQGGVRYMELAVALEPEDNAMLYNLAILQKNSGDLAGSLKTIDRALALNPESWNLQILKAGYSWAAGKKDEAQALYAKLQRPRAEEEFWEIMQAWYFAATQQRDKFYPQFQRSLETAFSPQIFEWIDQDPDLDYLRGDEQFKTLVAKHRERLVKKQ
jgi:regulator of sirC expression with transglutaminase-like and TPR domain